MAVLWAPQTCTPMALTAFTLPLACAGPSVVTAIKVRLPCIKSTPKFPQVSFNWKSRPLGKFSEDCLNSLFFIQLFSKPFELIPPVQFPYLLRVLPPIWRHFHKQSQVDFASKNGL